MNRATDRHGRGLPLPAALVLMVGICSSLIARPAWGVIILLKGQEKPVRGYFVREDDKAVVLRQLQPDGSTQERSVARSEIEDVIKTVDQARLESLQPARPDSYREYAEELAEKKKDPDAHVTALRLFLIAAYLDPPRLGRSCLLGMVPLARNANEQRRFRAMAYLLDPTHNRDVLTLPLPTRTTGSELEPRQAATSAASLAVTAGGQAARRDDSGAPREIKGTAPPVDRHDHL